MQIKTKMILSIIIAVYLTSCKKEPTYNPFDQVFDISIGQVVKNGCDTLSAGCGFFNLAEKSSPSYMYYQIHSENFQQVVAKGFTYHVDTFAKINIADSYSAKEHDSIMNVAINIDRLNSQIDKYSYNYLDHKEDSIRIVNAEIQDTINLRMKMSKTAIGNKYVRILEYFKTKRI